MEERRRRKKSRRNEVAVDKILPLSSPPVSLSREQPEVSLIYEEEKRRQRERGRQWGKKSKKKKEEEARSSGTLSKLEQGEFSPPPIVASFPVPLMLDGDHDGSRRGRWSTSFAAAAPTPARIRPRALEALRDTFAVESSGRRLKRPRIHVHFTYPRSVGECCCGCERGTDFLFVYVGLCNIFVLQFVVVVLFFFTDRELPDPFFGDSSVLDILQKHYNYNNNGAN